MCAVPLVPCPAFRLRFESCATRCSNRLQRLVGDTGQRRIVICRLTAVDIPVTVRHRMCLGPRGDCLQQHFQPILRIYPAKVRAMSAQFAEERLCRRICALADDGDPEPGDRRGFRRRCGMQAIGILECGFAECIQLVCRPQVCRQLFDKLGRQAHPIHLFELGRNADFCESLKPLLYLLWGKGTQNSRVLSLMAVRSAGNLKS